MSNAVQLSTSPTEAIVEKVNQLGLNKAAPVLGTNPAKLCRWLKQQGFVRKQVYVKEVRQPQPNQN